MIVFKSYVYNSPQPLRTVLDFGLRKKGLKQPVLLTYRPSSPTPTSTTNRNRGKNNRKGTQSKERTTARKAAGQAV